MKSFDPPPTLNLRYFGIDGPLYICPNTRVCNSISVCERVDHSSIFRDRHLNTMDVE